MIIKKGMPEGFKLTYNVQFNVVVMYAGMIILTSRFENLLIGLLRKKLLPTTTIFPWFRTSVSSKKMYQPPSVLYLELFSIAARGH